jgi:hypothetical protein
MNLGHLAVTLAGLGIAPMVPGKRLLGVSG